MVQVGEKKKLVAALFIDVKESFHNIFKKQFFTRMIKLRLDGNLVT